MTCRHCETEVRHSRRDQGIAQLICDCAATRLDDPAVCRQRRKRLKVVPWERTKRALGAERLAAWDQARRRRQLVELEILQAQIDFLKGRQ